MYLFEFDFIILSLTALITAILFLRCIYIGTKSTYIVSVLFGKFITLKQPGIYFEIPLIRKIYKFKAEQKIVVPVKEFQTLDLCRIKVGGVCRFYVNRPENFVRNIKSFKRNFLSYIHETTESSIKNKKMSELIEHEKRSGQSISYIINTGEKGKFFGIAISNFDFVIHFDEKIEEESYWLDNERNPYAVKESKE